MAGNTEQIKMMAEQSMVTIFGATFNIYSAIIILLILIIAWAMVRAHKDPANDFEWSHLVTDVDQATGKIKASATKILQLVGGITGTFIVIKLTLQNNISFDIFGVYLAYVASIDGFSKFMTARYGVRRDEYPANYPYSSQNSSPYGGYQPSYEPPVNYNTQPIGQPGVNQDNYIPSPKPRDID